jgi:ankyrin repeat protein
MGSDLSFTSLLHEQDSQGETPLSFAVKLGHKQTVEVLLGHGANPNTRNYRQEPLLSHPVLSNQFEIAKMLVASGADPTVQDLMGRTALLVAINSGHLQMYQMLSASSFGSQHQATAVVRCPLLDAVQTCLFNRKPDSIALLKTVIHARDCQMEVKNGQGKTALHLAVHFGDVEVASILMLAGASVLAKDGDGLTPLYYAVK